MSGIDLGICDMRGKREAIGVSEGVTNGAMEKKRGTRQRRCDLRGKGKKRKSEERKKWNLRKHTINHNVGVNDAIVF